jgi:hypothetical protein
MVFITCAGAECRNLCRSGCFIRDLQALSPVHFRAIKADFAVFQAEVFDGQQDHLAGQQSLSQRMHITNASRPFHGTRDDGVTEREKGALIGVTYS